MTRTNLAFSLLLTILIAEHSADSVGPPPPPATTFNSIKAARDKFDLEMKTDTKRPWDGMDLTGPHAFEKRPDPRADQH